MYKLTIQQKEMLLGKEFLKDTFFNPIQDIHGEWFISGEEVLLCDIEEFEWIKQLTTAEYIAPKTVLL